MTNVINRVRHHYQRQADTASATTPMQLSLPHSAAGSAPDGVASAATPEQLNLPHIVAASASKLPRQALDQAR